MPIERHKTAKQKTEIKKPPEATHSSSQDGGGGAKIPITFHLAISKTSSVPEYIPTIQHPDTKIGTVLSHVHGLANFVQNDLFEVRKDPILKIVSFIFGSGNFSSKKFNLVARGNYLLTTIIIFICGD